MSRVEAIAPVPALRDLLATPEPPDLGPRRRDGTLPVREINARLDGFFAGAGATIPRPSRELLRGAALLWHDHLDASHEISQGIGTPGGSFLHGVMHRREPDYWNAKYWFRRAGPQACFPALARGAGDFLAAAGQPALAARLAPGGRWDAFAFVDACEEAAQSSATGDFRARLRAVQQIEFHVLLAHLCSGAGAE